MYPTRASKKNLGIARFIYLARIFHEPSFATARDEIHPMCGLATTAVIKVTRGPLA
ncbi:MAG: hypothetical protein JW829_03635 [Pirellulales bacterium]|nr:hypothetical protein [Pirellulales bacterium]